MNALAWVVVGLGYIAFVLILAAAMGYGLNGPSKRRRGHLPSRHRGSLTP